MPWTSNKFRAVAALLLLSVLWGYNWVVMKNALQDAGPFQFGALRTLLGALCLLGLIMVLRRPIRPKEIPTLIVLGLLQTSGFTGLIIWALVEGGAGKTAILTYTMPFWVMVMAWPMLGEKIQGSQWLAVLLSIMGILFILDPLHLGTDLFSMLLAVLAGISWALSVMLAKKLHQRAPEVDLLSDGMANAVRLIAPCRSGFHHPSSAYRLDTLFYRSSSLQRRLLQCAGLVALALCPAKAGGGSGQHGDLAGSGHWCAGGMVGVAGTAESWRVVGHTVHTGLTRDYLDSRGEQAPENRSCDGTGVMSA